MSTVPKGEVPMNRTKQEKWDKKHMETVSARIPTADAARFLIACNRNGDTRYSVLKAAVYRYLEENPVERVETTLEGQLFIGGGGG